MASVSTFKELLDRYQQGERDFTGSELDADPENDLSGVCLDGIDLSNSWVMADFRGANLRGARFRDANVKTCDFTGADVSGADFSGAALCATVFSGARMENARFEGAYWHSHEFKAGEFPVC
jgi:uncharacterized protein YjbI with pentapeptide repeats